MKIVLNIEKKHLIFFSLFLVFIGSIFVIGAGQWNQQGTAPSSGVGHQDLYTNNMYSWTKEGVIKIWDAKGNWLGLGSSSGEPNRFDFSVDSEDRVLFYGNQGPDYKMERFTVKATDIMLIGNICSDEQGTNCVSTKGFINKMKELKVCSDLECIFDDANKPIKEVLPGVWHYIGVNSATAQKFCEEKGYRNNKDVVYSPCDPPNDGYIAQYDFDFNNNVGWINQRCNGQNNDPDTFIEFITCYNN